MPVIASRAHGEHRSFDYPHRPEQFYWYSVKLFSNRQSTRKLLLAGRTALASIPDAPARFPVACWFRDQLIGQMHGLVLSGEQMRLPC